MYRLLGATCYLHLWSRIGTEDGDITCLRKFVNFYVTTRRHVTGDSTLCSHCRERLESRIVE